MADVNMDNDTTWPAAGKGYDAPNMGGDPPVTGWPSGSPQVDPSYPDANRQGDNEPNMNGNPPVTGWPGR